MSGTKVVEEKKVKDLAITPLPTEVTGPTDNSVNQVILEPVLKVKTDDEPPMVRQALPPMIEIPPVVVAPNAIVKEEPKEPKEPKELVPVYVTPPPPQKPVKKDPPAREPGYAFTLFDAPQEIVSKKDDDNEDDGEESLFGKDDDEFTQGSMSSDQYLDEEGMMEIRRTRERLEQQARERREKLKAGKTHEMSKDEFKNKWETPAYLRRGVKMDNVPHSSEPMISRYNLNDDNNLLGNNKFLHDNVD